MQSGLLSETLFRTLTFGQPQDVDPAICIRSFGILSLYCSVGILDVPDSPTVTTFEQPFLLSVYVPFALVPSNP